MNKNVNIFSVFVGSEEVSDHYIPLNDAIEVCEYYKEKGYDHKEIWLYNKETDSFLGTSNE